MQFLTTILALTASVSAIDIALRNRGDCSERGGGFTCTGVNPNVNIFPSIFDAPSSNHPVPNVRSQQCCGIPTGSVGSVVIYYVPTGWALDVRGHEGGRCDAMKSSETLLGGTWKCLRSGPYTGAGYGFRNFKRGAPEGTCSSTSENCVPVMPDQLFLGDGQKYNIVDMDSELVEELAELAKNGTVAADIPETFKAFEIAA